MSSTFGNVLHLSIFGQSHSPAIGCSLDGIPAGIAVDQEELQAFLDRRAPGRDDHPEEVNAEYRRLSQLQDTPEAEIRKALAEDAVAAALAAKKVQRFLLDNAQVTTVTDAPEKE